MHAFWLFYYSHNSVHIINKSRIRDAFMMSSEWRAHSDERKKKDFYTVKLFSWNLLRGTGHLSQLGYAATYR